MRPSGIWVGVLAFGSLLLVMFSARAEEKAVPPAPAKASPPTADACVVCHRQRSPALVMEWEHSRHAAMNIGCADCHGATKEKIGAWLHQGAYVSALVTPKDCARCHEPEYKEFSVSHHAMAGEILASLDNVLAEKMAGQPGNVADAVNGCWQCHGTIVKFRRDAKGEILHTNTGQPVLDPTTWPNSGIGRLNPDGSKGSCHACHSVL